jgi:tetratricopeptide (TPR) repeat protein
VFRAQAIVWAAAVGVFLGGCGKSNTQPEGRQPLAAGGEPVLGWHAGGERAERAPISLTASDGSGLALISVDVRAVIEDPLAFTELHLKFHNPEPRRREGRFEITLPQGAAISRFAMRVGDEFQEGEVVERRRAQAIYEDFLHRKQDPALLENDAGNEFAARVFPIEPNADKELIIAYSQELVRRDTPYQLLFQGLPQLDALDVDVRVGSNAASGAKSVLDARSKDMRLTLHERTYVPAADLEVRLPRQRPVALRSDDLVIARVVPVLDIPDAAVTGLTVLFDTSASRALGFGAQIERLATLLAELQKSESQPLDVCVIAFDQAAEEVFRGPASEFGLRAKARLLARDALGASDLGRAFTFAAHGGAVHPRMLLVGDGVITAGIEDSTALREAVARLAAHGVQRLDVLAEGGIQDRETLALVVRAGLPQTGVILDARLPVGQVAERLRKATRDKIQVNIAGARWVYPDVLEGIQPGDERLVFAELPAEVPVQIELVGAGAEAHDTLEVPRPLLERAWARAKIESMTRALRALPPDAERERAQAEQAIAALSVEHRVVSDFTAMLVLEGPNDYARFGLNQIALTSILRVSNQGLELWNRTTEQDRPVQHIARDDIEFERPEPPTSEGALQPERKGQAEASRTGLRGGGDGIGQLPAARATLPSAANRARTVSPAAASPAKEELAKKSSGVAAAAPPAERLEQAGPELRMRAPFPEPTSAAAPRAAAPRGLNDNADEILDRRDPLAAGSGKSLEKQGLGSGADKAKSSGAVFEPEPAAPRVQIASDALEPRLELRVRGSRNLPSSEVARAVRGSVTARARQCFTRSASQSPTERLNLELAISDKGSVTDVYASGGTVSDRAAQSCVMQSLRGARFPKPAAATGAIQLELSWSMQPLARQPVASGKPASAPRPVKIPAPELADAYDGVLSEVLVLLARGETGTALAKAGAAHGNDPGDVISLVALGEALEAQHDYAQAARAYGSLIDLFPSRADLRRMAGARLERLPSDGLSLAVDTYRRAAHQRPDQPSGPRALAYALLKQSDRAQAFETLERAIERGYNSDRFDGVDHILREDLGLVGAAWVRVDSSAESRVQASLLAHGAKLATTPSTRFVLQWETDANDVDFHIYDGRGGHAYYMRPHLSSGGDLYADITTGYGPECFAIQGKARAYPYVLQAHYFARGPMGFGMGRVQVVDHDGNGDVRFGEYPFVIMRDKAFVELARLSGPVR